MIALIDTRGLRSRMWDVAARVGSVARRALIIELRIYESIGRAIVRRPAVPRNATGFHYHRPIRVLLIVFIALSAIEIPIIDLIVHPWPVVRIGFLILGIWGLTWMVGLLCGFAMRPHTVGPIGIQVRDGLEFSVAVPWDDVESVTRISQTDEPKATRIAEVDGSRVLSVRMQDDTNVQIALERPVEVRLPGRRPKGGRHEVDTIRLWVDDVDGYMQAVRQHIP